MADIKYTKDHEIISMDGDIASIGITDYASEALGDLVFVELPEAGTKLATGDEFAVVESVKIASEIYTPVAGEIVEVNNALEDDLDKLKESIENGGWIVRIKVDGEAEGLMTEEEYNDFVKGLHKF